MYRRKISLYDRTQCTKVSVFPINKILFCEIIIFIKRFVLFEREYRYKNTESIEDKVKIQSTSFSILIII